jgi:hypothetical protein
MQNSPATLIPDPVEGRKYYQGHDLSRARMSAIYSVGRTTRQAVRSLARARRWGRVSCFEVLEGGDTAYTWGLRFVACGVGMKAAGIHVPGGVVCTWWR